MFIKTKRSKYVTRTLTNNQNIKTMISVLKTHAGFPNIGNTDLFIAIGDTE